MTTGTKNEDSNKDFIPAPDEHGQNRINETIFLKLNDLEYRVDDLELSKKPRATKQPGNNKGGRN